MYLKKIDRGARLIFLALKFLIFLFFWVWKNLSYFSGFEDFSLIFLGVTILIPFIFLGVRLNNLDLQNRSNNDINE